jgi:SNF2 family DNA or RNA helicase
MKIMDIETYNYKTEPYKHQRETLAKSAHKNLYALFLEMGLGKSKILLDNAAILFDQEKISGLLIVSPKGNLRNWDVHEVNKHLPDHIQRNVLVWQPNHTKQWLKDYKEMVEGDSDGILNIFLVNVEAFATVKACKFVEEFLVTHDAMMAIDESTTIKNPKAKRTKHLIKLAPLADYRRILTGFPITKAPLDLYSQCYFLSPNLLGFSSYYAFSARYAITQARRMGSHSFQQIIGFQRLEELQESIKDFSIRKTKDQCLDLPAKVYTKRLVELTDEQKKAYATMKQKALMVLENEVFTTVNVLTQIMRLQQIVAGSLRNEDGETIVLKNNRVRTVLDLLEETSGKVVIFAMFQTDIQQLEKAIADKFGENSVASYYGKTPQDERQRIIDRFQDSESELRYFISNPQTGGRGITLTEASTMIFYSNSYDLELRVQAEDRIHRIGQEKSCTYIDLVSENTVDEKILQNLLSKVKISNEILGEIRNWFK